MTMSPGDKKLFRINFVTARVRESNRGRAKPRRGKLPVKETWRYRYFKVKCKVFWPVGLAGPGPGLGLGLGLGLSCARISRSFRGAGFGLYEGLNFLGGLFIRVGIGLYLFVFVWI